MNISDPGFHPPSALALPEPEVQLWHLDLGALSVAEDRWQQWLSADEQARAKRFLSLRARQQFVVTRSLLRIALAAYLAADPRKLVFQHSAKEKPSLGSPHAESGITFNLSHASGVALLAFSRRRELGVDVERVRRDLDVDAIARRYFSLHEERQLAAVNSEERHEAFFRCWTRKEAYLKAQGAGLSLPLEQFDVSVAIGDTNALLSTRPDPSEAARWSLREVPAGPGYVAALCVAGHEWHLREWS
jgi:4'-phosphopantetheinyl transferase